MRVSSGNYGSAVVTYPGFILSTYPGTSINLRVLTALLDPAKQILSLPHTGWLITAKLTALLTHKLLTLNPLRSLSKRCRVCEGSRACPARHSSRQASMPSVSSGVGSLSWQAFQAAVEAPVGGGQDALTRMPARAQG